MQRSWHTFALPFSPTFPQHIFLPFISPSPLSFPLPPFLPFCFIICDLALAVLLECQPLSPPQHHFFSPRLTHFCSPLQRYSALLILITPLASRSAHINTYRLFFPPQTHFSGVYMSLSNTVIRDIRDNRKNDFSKKAFLELFPNKSGTNTNNAHVK